MSTKKIERKYPRVQVHFTKPSMTKQSFKDECNINKIMAKFQKTGAITHYANHAGSYGDCTAIELLDAELIVANANTMFEELPSSIRKKFENDPAKFLDFVQDEKNHEEMVELGLKESPIQPIVKPGDAKVTPEENASASPEDTGKGDVSQAE